MEDILNEAVEVCEIDEFKEKMKNYKGAYVYAFFNKINEKVYIGSSRRLVGRFSNYHRAISKTAKFHSLLLKRVFNKYSKEDFWFLIIEHVKNPEKIVDREQFYLDKYKPFGARGYNCAASASSCFGVKHTEETREKCRTRQQGEKGFNSRLKNKDIEGIFNDFAWGNMDRQKIADKYKVSKRQIRAILKREQWKHIEIEKFTLDKANECLIKKMTNQEAELVGEKLKSGQSPLIISQEYGIDIVNVHNINRGCTFPHIKALLSPNEEYIFDFERTNKRNEDTWENIRREIKKNPNIKIRELTEKFSVSRGIVWKIKRELGVQKEQKAITLEKAQEVGNLLRDSVPYKEIMVKCDICQVSIMRINKGTIFPEVKDAIAPASPYIRIPPRVVLLSAKKKMVSLLREGEGVAKIMASISLSRSYVNTWKRKFQEKHSHAQNP